MGLLPLIVDFFKLSGKRPSVEISSEKKFEYAVRILMHELDHRGLGDGTGSEDNIGFVGFFCTESVLIIKLFFFLIWVATLFSIRLQVGFCFLRSFFGFRFFWNRL